MKRFLFEDLKKWKERKDRKPLVLMGARQVGKTWIMKEFGKKCYKKVAYISFYNNKNMIDVFENDYDIDRILLALKIETSIDITPGDTLIIFDEIQNAPKALESLKYFCEEKNMYHIVAAGSLLGVALHEGISYPVGKVDIMHLYPMNFREFLYAMGEDGLEELLEKEDFNLIDNFRDKYIMWLKNYYYIGGMPEVVSDFAINKDYVKVREIQNLLLNQYKGDFGKHIGTRELPRINMVWESIPMQLAKENKKFFFGGIKKGARSNEFEVAIQWLCDSGLIIKVNKINKPFMPLVAYKEFSSYKLFMIDVGLLGALSGLDKKTILDGSDIFVEFKGALTEQYVLNQIISDTKYTPYYFGTKKATFEQDFIIQKEDQIIPIEVKAMCNVKSQSLKAFNEKYKPSYSVRFSLRKYEDQGWMKNIPLYAVSLL